MIKNPIERRVEGTGVEQEGWGRGEGQRLHKEDSVGNGIKIFIHFSVIVD